MVEQRAQIEGMLVEHWRKLGSQPGCPYCRVPLVLAGLPCAMPAIIAGPQGIQSLDGVATLVIPLACPRCATMTMLSLASVMENVRSPLVRL